MINGTIARICAGCGDTLRLGEAFAAEEAGREIEVVVCRCPGCGERSEEPAVIADLTDSDERQTA